MWKCLVQRSIGRCGTCCFPMHNIEAAAHPLAGLCQPCHRTDEGAACASNNEWSNRPDYRLIDQEVNLERFMLQQTMGCALLWSLVLVVFWEGQRISNKETSKTPVFCVFSRVLYFLSWFLTWERKFRLSKVSTHFHPFSIITGLFWSVRGSVILCGRLLKAHSTFKCPFPLFHCTRFAWNFYI